MKHIPAPPPTDELSKLLDEYEAPPKSPPETPTRPPPPTRPPTPNDASWLNDAELTLSPPTAGGDYK